METQKDKLWVFLVCSAFCHINFVWALTIMFLTWFTITIICWSHQGGPAWGKYYMNRMNKPGSPSSNKPIIPGPRGLPIIGSMSLMTNLAHHKISSMAKSLQSSRLLAFSLGETRVIVTCHPDVAKEILNSPVFADRPVKESAYSLMFNRAIGFAPYGVYWRTLRRISAVHLFSPKQIKSAEIQRMEIVSQMVSMFKYKKIVIREVLKSASLSNMMRSVFGAEYGLDSVNDEMSELRKLVDEGYDLLGEFNWGDHVSWLRDFDVQKIRFRCSKLVPKVNRFVSRVIEQHRSNKWSVVIGKGDFVDVLLSLQPPDKLSDSDMVAVLWEMIFRGTDTVAVLIEWILARMVLHPHIQSTVQNELDNVVGRSRAVQESDLPSLKYLTAVIKEVLRLHPPGPLLSWARLSITDTCVDGYHVPSGTTAMVNMWAISRDPEIWVDPVQFNPDRFLNKDGVEFSVLGSDLRLAPFGSGRRVCPGKALGVTTVSFWVAALLHEFEWRPSDEKPVDLTEVLKLSCEMKNPMCANLRPRRRLTDDV